MEQILNHIWELIVATSGVVIVFIFKKVWHWITDYLLFSNNEKLLATLEDIVEVSVSDIQEIADKYKKASEDGKLTDSEKAELHALGKNKVWELLPKIKKSILDNYFGKEMIDNFVDSMIKKIVTKNGLKK